MIANRKIPSAMRAPTTAPITAKTLSITTPTKDIGALPMNPRSPANHRKMTPTISPMTIKTAPTARLFPDPKYAVKMPAMILATANTSVSMLRKYWYHSIFFLPP